MTTTLEKPSVEKYQACYLVDVFDDDILYDLKVLTRMEYIPRQDDEILVSLHLLNVWIESDFEPERVYTVAGSTKQYLTDLYEVIGQETGYIIFRP